MSDQLKNKLQDFEVAPPPGVWENIAGELVQNNMPFARKMYHYEVAPPSGSFENLVNHLKNYTDQVPAPSSILNKPVYKMAVAAAILGVIVIGGWYFFHNSSLKKQHFSPHTAELNPENKSGDINKTLDSSSTNPLHHLQIAAASNYGFTKGKKV